jgi:demethylmenaquinone methyltransferase/2-methoxy-6-polyprenyl-1,4-benzoquinol methylase
VSRGDDAPGPPTAPHPVLKDYYDSESQRRSFVAGLFDSAAQHYDWVCKVGSFGSGRLYRRQVLQRAGLRKGMRLLDLATGTGLVAEPALHILGDARAVIGLDPSVGMLREARKTLASPLIQGRAEELPFGANRFDMLSIGYALRHVASLEVTFAECARVLKPGGRLLILEISRPRSTLGLRVSRLYLQQILPRFMRVTTGSAQAERLMRYYWDTIAQCVPPETILDVLRGSGFVDVDRRVFAGIISEYIARKPTP